MTDITEPIRKSSLPSVPSPEWEFFTWFPHPDGGGDMVHGQRQRGVQVRRRVSYSDWEPVHPDRWANEPESEARTAVVEPPTNRAALRQHIADTIRAAACPGDCGQTEEECARQRIQPGAWHHGVLVEVEGRPELFADAVLAVLPGSADRAAVLREVATLLHQRASSIDALSSSDFGEEARAVRELAEAAETLRRMADEAQPETPSMKLARASVQAMTDTLQRPIEKPTQPRTDDPDHRHAAALHFLGKPIPTDDEDGARP